MVVSEMRGDEKQAGRRARTAFHRARLDTNPLTINHCSEPSKVDGLVAMCNDLSRIFVSEGVKCVISTNCNCERQSCGVTYGHAEDALVSLVSCHFEGLFGRIKGKREERMEKGKKLDGRSSFK